jgi:hypothetical protein
MHVESHSSPCPVLSPIISTYIPSPVVTVSPIILDLYFKSFNHEIFVIEHDFQCWLLIDLSTYDWSVSDEPGLSWDLLTVVGQSDQIQSTRD